MNIEVGNLYKVGYTSFTDSSSGGGIWATDLEEKGHFLPEGTPGLVIKRDAEYSNVWQTLIGDKIFLVNEYYLKEL